MKVKLVVFGVFAAVLFAGLLSCEQPFKAGLGPVVDTRPPTVTLDAPGAGEYIYGKMPFSGSAEDDYVLVSVEIMVTNYPDIEYCREWTPVSLTKKVNRGTWSYDLNTVMFPEGNIKLRLKVTDSVNKTSETDEIAFYVNNAAPVINLATPLISRGTGIGEVGGPHLNYYATKESDGTITPVDPETMIPGIGFQRRVDKGSSLQGSIVDDEGIYIGAATPDGTKFPPQIRMWWVNDDVSDPADPCFKPGYLPTVEEVPWENFTLNVNLFYIDAGNYQFAYEVPPVSGRYYAFEIRAQRSGKRETEVHYPRDYYNLSDWTINPSDTAEEKAFKIENRYVIVYVTTPQTEPTADLYTFENLSPNAWTGSRYPAMEVSEGVPVTDDIAHPWVNSIDVNKDGPFTLRVKAQHPEGISRAEVYWEKEDKSERGRFIWDVTTAPADVKGDPVQGWPVTNNEHNVNPIVSYSNWGYQDPHSPSIRHFIFTYNHDGNDTIPDDPAYNSMVRGKSKIQKYNGTDVTGTESVWYQGKRAGLWSLDSSAADWEDYLNESGESKLKEGLYNVEVYVRSVSGSGARIETPQLTFQIRLDWGKPEITLEASDIDGAYGVDLDDVFEGLVGIDRTSVVVNGVVRPRPSISDARPEDSNIRSTTDGYFADGSEKFYVLVGENDKDPMDNLISAGITRINGKRGDWWPAGFSDLPAAVPGVTVYKHGSVANSQFRFKTSGLYPVIDPTEGGTLADGLYWLYVFARDKAFNVGAIEAMKIRVLAESDKPRFEFSEPHTGKAKNPTDTDIDTMAPGEDIKIRVTDDDGLDLDNMTIQFTGFKYSYTDKDGNPVTEPVILEGSPVMTIAAASVFGTRASEDNKKDRTGTIRQSALLDKLRENGNSAYWDLWSSEEARKTAARLPDGMYQLIITVDDFRTDKLRVVDTDPLPDTKRDQVQFWFVVDGSPPYLETVAPATGGYLTTGGAQDVTGRVTDRNGPITMTAEITDSSDRPYASSVPQPRINQAMIAKESAPGSDYSTPPLPFTGTTGVDWRTAFKVPVTFDENFSGTFNVVLTFTDRFGNQTVARQKYSIDTQPPRVELRTRMDTVDRSGFADDVLTENGYGTFLFPINHKSDLAYLVNGVVSFNMNAIDDVAVKEARWWLVKDGTPDFDWDYDFETLSDPNFVKWGSFTENFAQTTNRIDTTITDIPDGKYHLYGMAQDMADLYSNRMRETSPNVFEDPAVTGPRLLQTIYVYQDSDKPFFGPITPGGNVIGAAMSDRFIRGVIYEDDGFTNNSNAVVNGTVRVWMSNGASGNPGYVTSSDNGLTEVGVNGGTIPDKIDSSDFTSGTYGYLLATESLPISAADNSVVRQGKNISLSIPMNELFPSMFAGATSDGTKHFIIEVTDSANGKILANGAPDSTTKTVRKYFHFDFDQTAPEITLTYPDREGPIQPIPFGGLTYQNPISHPTNPGFGLQGSIKDANLAMVGGQYVFQYRINNEERKQYLFIATPDPLTPGVPQTVTFNIDPGTFTSNIDWNNIEDGANTLWIFAVDKSGQEASVSLSFFKDMAGPQSYLNENEVILEDIDGSFAWWPAKALPTPTWDPASGTPAPSGALVPEDSGDGTAAKWFGDRRTKLADKDVPVIAYDAKNPQLFVISGTFEDEASKIKPSSFKYRFDEPVTDTTTWVNGSNGTSGVTLNGATLTFNADSNGDPTGRSASWKVELKNGSNLLTEGLHSIMVQFEDEHGNVFTSKNYAFRVSGVPPNVTLTRPSNTVYGNRTSGQTDTDTIFTVSGIATSPNLKTVNLIINHVDSMKISGYKPYSTSLVPQASPANKWSFYTPDSKVLYEYLEWTGAVSRANIIAASDAAQMKEGIYELSVIAEDMDGNESSEEVWEFTIDTSSPAFSGYTGYTPATTTDITPYTTSIRNNMVVLTSSDPRLQVTVTDTFSNVTAVERQIRRYVYGATNDATRWEYWNFTTSNWMVVAETTARDTAAYWSPITITTADQRPEFMIDWRPKTEAGALAAQMDDGFYAYRVRAKDSAKVFVGSGETLTDWGAIADGNPAISDFAFFFYANGTPSLDHNNPEANSFSSRILPSNEIMLTGTSESPNRFNTIAVTVERVNTTVSDAALAAMAKTIIATTGGAAHDQTGSTSVSTLTWNWSVPIKFDPASAPDGSYRIRFTITDMAGKTTENSRTITLDNTPPKAEVQLPRVITNAELGSWTKPANYADSETSILQTIIGGEDASFNGTTKDDGPRGSASGVSQIWYHLGYLEETEDNSADKGPAFPTQAAVRGTVVTGTDLGGAANNALFDAAAANPATAWFKYADGADVPKGFTALGTGLDPMAWSLEIKDTLSLEEGLRFYANPDYQIKTGTGAATYNQADGRWLVKAINETGLPSALNKSGLYSLPLWIRVADTAGNVSYYSYDIWIYPNGDYPTTMISNPSDAATSYTQARGGAVNIDGTASDNRSVKKVIYRIKADNARGTDYATATSADANIVTVTGGDALGPTAPEFSIPDFGSALGSPNPFTGTFSRTGWYYANLESSGPNVPWSFQVNASDEIKTLIPTSGFYFDGTNAVAGTTANRNMIRVRVEVLVFDGDDDFATNYNKMSLGPTGGTVALPRAFTRVFYLKDSAPTITVPQVSTITAFDNATTAAFDPTTVTAANYETYVADRIRSKRFAIRAQLNGSGQDINQVLIRIPGEVDATGGGGWRTVWARNTNGATTIPNTAINTGVRGLKLTSTSAQTSQLTFYLDTTGNLANAYTNFFPVQNGGWAAGGGKFTVEVLVRDVGTPAGQASYTFEVGVDNFAPIADRVTTITNPKVAGSTVVFQGRAFDYQGAASAPIPAYKGLNRVYAWFTKNGKYVNMNNKESRDPAAADPTMNAWEFRNAEIRGPDSNSTTVYDGNNVGNINMPATNTPATPGENSLGPGSMRGIQYPPVTYNVTTGAWTNDGWVKVVSEATAGVMDNKMTWQPNQNYDIRWDFTANSAILPDGPITLNYLVIDNAGNASYYTQNMTVMNNFPKISDIVLFTNNMGTGAVFTTHEGDEAYSHYAVKNEPAGYLNSGFIAKNKTIGFGIVTDNTASNWPLNYQVQYVKRVRFALNSTNLGYMAGLRATGTTTQAATIGNTGFYTIDTYDGISDSTWRDFGVKEASPAKGNHFRFDATASQVTGMNYTANYVYGYQIVTGLGGTAVARNNENPTPTEPKFDGTLTYSDGRPVLDLSFDVFPGSLYFNGDTQFGTTATSQIIEAFGSQPGKPEWEASNGPWATIGKDQNYNNINETAFFLIKVWDTVDQGQNGFTEADMLYDVAVVGMNVFISDTTNPTARLYDLNPYTETSVVGQNIGDANQQATKDNAAAPTDVGYNILRGGLYNTGTERAVKKSGHIEPRHNSGALQPYVDGTQTNANSFETGDSNQNTNTADGRRNYDRVSGRVILRGVAHDDQLLDQISINIAGAATANQPGIILQRETNTASANYGKLVAASGKEAYAYESLNWQTGHTVEWAYVWDTEGYNTTGTPAQGVTITVSSRDLNGAGGAHLSSATDALTAGSAVTAASSHNQATVDIVGYVTGLERETPKFATARSRQGWYSFFQGEPNIAVIGYNLGRTSGVGVTLDSDGSGTGTGLTVAYGAAAATATNIRNRFHFTIPTDAKSGKIDVTVGGDSVLNHLTSHTDKSWNREYNYYTSGSDLWVNKPYAHIWRTAQSGTAPATYFGNNSATGGSMDMQNPAMSLQYVPTTNNGTVGALHGAWAIYGSEGFYYGRNDNTARTNIMHQQIEPYSDTDIDFYNGNGNTNYAANRRITVLASNQQDGAATWGFNSNIAVTTVAAANYTNLIGADNNRPTDRWQNGRVVATYYGSGANGNAGNIYATTYDSANKNLRYASKRAANAVTALALDGGGTLATGIVNSNNANWGVSGASARAGRWSAVGYTDDGGTYAYPVIAYYDESNDTLRLAYVNGTGGDYSNPTSGQRWTRRYVLNTNDPLFRGSGMYVSMKIDSTMRVHLAFYNNVKNTVVYAVGTPTGEFTAYTVDNVVVGGTWTDISLDKDGRPWIVYGNTNRTGNYDGVRIAYQTGGTDAADFTRELDDPVTGKSIQGWEALSMPADYRINDDRLNIEVWPPNLRSDGYTPADDAVGWNAAVGYGSDQFRIGYFFKPDSGLMANW